MKPDTVVTSALIYANGPMHIGHLVEYIQTDIYVRYLKLAGKDAVYCGADDTHGTPIQINAEQAGKTPEEFILEWRARHLKDYERYNVQFDSYHTTNSEENRILAEKIYAKLKEAGHIYEKDVEQLYDEKAGRFLPDRYVKGTCPECGAEDQYGDVCEQCNATYKTTDLVKPYSTLTGETPVLRTSNHHFFKLSKYGEWLREWLTKNERLQPEIRNQILGWVDKGLEDWCISRDPPYFGFKIPETEKYFYVWLDAPIGYISSLARQLGDTETALEVWNEADIQHFIGKDIIYFHLLFWPAVLHAAGLKVPDTVVVHGFLTVNGEKMSKSRGTFLTADEFADAVPDTEYLRYYYAASLTHAMTDIDLSLDDFTQRVNSELVGNLANFIYRTLSFIKKHYDGKLGPLARDEKAGVTLAKAKELAESAQQAYATYEFRKATQALMHLSQLGNQYFQECEPWKQKEEAKGAVTLCANLVRDLAVLWSPVLPRFSGEVLRQLNLAEEDLDDVGRPLEEHEIGEPAIIWRPMEKLDIHAPAESAAAPSLDLRVARITSVERHPKADKLYIEHVDDGSGKERVIVSGLVPYYTPEELTGKQIILVNNLKAAKLRGVESQGMLLAVEDAEKNVTLLEAPDAKPGDPVETGGPRGEREITIDEFFSHRIEAKDGAVVLDGKPLTLHGKPLTSKADGKVS